MPPEGVDPGSFRQAMALLPTGVTVVTAPGPDGPAGATANAVTSLSLDPMMMLACLDRGSRTLRAVQAADAFGVNVLAARQEETARAFASKAPVPEKWTGVEWTDLAGIPALEGCIAGVACSLRDVISAGDHVIVTGEVRAVRCREGEPLVFHAGRYRGLGKSND